MVGTKSNKLEDQAATAALYVTKADKAKQSGSNYPLDADNKLSSASAATSLKYANPRDLPSFPTTGLEHGEAGAGAAASLANANHKEFELWKPAGSAPASRAAMLAKDYKPAPLWQPEDSAAGSKAAHIAAKEVGRVNIWQPEPTTVGNSAAGQAMRAKDLGPQVFSGSTADDNKKALIAATGAMASNRRRAGSTPIAPPPAYPDAANSAANALKAATSVGRPDGRGSQIKLPPPASSPIDVARIHNAAVTNLSREMYTANPPVAPEVEEKKRQQVLRAAAVSMAKQMYDVQQRAIDEATSHGKGDSLNAATSAQNRPPSSMAVDEEQSTPQYVNLQEAAQKLAAERLSKLHDEHAAYRNYYGATLPTNKRLSLRGRPRRRASSDGNAPTGDEERSKMIRNQMSLFKDELAQVDSKKRQKDRDALMAAAQRNVTASMTGLDERVFNETGKVSPAMMEEWEIKAKARAKADSDSRMANHGRVNIGGGKYLDQSEVDAIAASKVQPTLDEITAKADNQRARDAELRRQQEERERVAAEKVADQRERDLKTKEEWKRFRGKYLCSGPDEEKAEARAKKAEEKQLREEEKRKAKAPKGIVADEDRPTTASEPPILDPIPSVEPMVADGEELRRPQLRTTATEEIKLQAEEEKRASKLAEERGQKSLSAEVNDVLPPTGFTEGDDAGTATPAPLDASAIAKRVLSAPDVDLSEEVAVPNINPDEAKSTNVESTTISSPPTPAPEPATILSKPTEVIHQRTAIPAARTETIVTGPPPAQKQQRGEGKVSSWLKSKLRRSSKPGKPEISKPVPIEDTSNERAFVGGANLTTATSTSKSSTNPGSVREVAMAGRSSNAPADVTSASAPLGSDDDDSHVASARDTGKQQHRSTRSSSPISSLSSDEGEHPRGRSQLRREVTSGSDEDGGEQEFEEARDHFETEALAPPTKLKDTRAGDSPIRDSIFKEDL
ncbi:MAG: hypothetical protein LQ344_006112 [Seirophora lacunosa]|nr:MAG: hypothetical protein LQ344_006112 [Seirophora lacunosa]